MAAAASLKWRGLASTTESYAKSVAWAASASLRRIMQARPPIPAFEIVFLFNKFEKFGLLVKLGKILLRCIKDKRS
jgi:hypothetical protein